MKPGMRRRTWLVGALVAVSTAVVFASGDISIQPIPTDEGRVRVSFSARDSWNLNTRDFLLAGTQVIFDYDVELRKPGPLWLSLFDTTLARVPVSTTAQFDTLKRKYVVSRMRHGSVFA